MPSSSATIPAWRGWSPGYAQGRLPDRLNVRLATAAIVHIALDMAYWKQVRWGCGFLEFLIRPKLFR